MATVSIIVLLIFAHQVGFLGSAAAMLISYWQLESSAALGMSLSNEEGMIEFVCGV